MAMRTIRKIENVWHKKTLTYLDINIMSPMLIIMVYTLTAPIILLRVMKFINYSFSLQYRSREYIVACILCIQCPMNSNRNAA